MLRHTRIGETGVFSDRLANYQSVSLPNVSGLGNSCLAGLLAGIHQTTSADLSLWGACGQNLESLWEMAA